VPCKFQPDETYTAARDRTIREDCAEYGLTVAEARDNLPRIPSEWLDGAKEWIRGGATPSQAWINAARRDFPEWWDRRICHDLPDAFDRMARAGRSLYRTQAERAATWSRF
jgi:hypothetical protein